MKRKAAKRSFAIILSALLTLLLFPLTLYAEADMFEGTKSELPVSQVGAPHLDISPDVTASNRIIVRYKDNANRSEIRSATEAERFEPLSRLNMEVLDLAPGADAGSVVARLNANPDVLYAEPDIKIRKHATKPKDASRDSTSIDEGQAAKSAVSTVTPFYPSDPLFPSQWGLHNEGQSIEGSYGSYDVDIDAPEAWGYTKGKQETIVAILDTGVDVNHPDLADNVWRNPDEIPSNGIDDDANGFIDDYYGWNFYQMNNEPYSIYDDDFYGTQIAGILAAKDNGLGITGVAPGIRFMPLKIMGYDGGYVSDALNAIDYAERMGVKIVNISWSTETFSHALKDAIDASDMLFIASAGDDYVNINKDIFPEYPAAYDSDNVLSVAGIDMHGGFRNAYGIKSVDLAAPSDKIITTLPTRDPGIGAEIDNGTYKAIYNELGFEGMWTGDPSVIGSRQDGFNRALNYLGKQDGSSSSILLVSDEELPEQSDLSVLRKYKALLDATDARYDVVKVAPGANGPSLEELKPYDIVIWFTGYGTGSSPDGLPTTLLRNADQTNLTAYLNGGGRLMLTGDGALTNIETSDFVSNVLHLDFVRYDFFRGSGDYSRWRAADGQAGTIYEGGHYDISARVYADYKSNDDSVTHINLKASMDDYDYDNGAYMAPAFVSGVAALVLGQDPTLDAKSVKERVIVAGKHLESLWNPESQDYMNNGRIVDAVRAVSDDDVPGKLLKPLQTDSLDQASGDMQDIYYVHLNAGDTLNLSLTSDAASFALALYNSDLKSVLDWDAQEKVVGYAMMNGAPATISYQADRTGYYYVGVFFTGSSGDYTLGMNTDSVSTKGNYEDTDLAIKFDGPWSEKAAAGYSGGTIKTIDATGSAKFAFTGSMIELTALKNDSMGIADIYVDGVKAASPSLYSKTTQAKQSVFKQSLRYGYHTVEVAWTGKADPAAKRTVHAINVDALVVGDSDAFASVMEESDAAFTFNGAWSLQSNANYSGSHAQVTNSSGAYAEVSFTGTNAILVAATTPKSGKVTVMVDDDPGTVKTIDLYSEVSRYQVSVFDTGELSYGPHTLRIVNEHAKNEKSGGYETTVDAVVVEKPAGENLSVYQDMNPFVKYAGVWTLHLSSKNSGGSAKYTDGIGNSAKLSFQGTKVTLLSQTGANRGMIDIYIDGEKANEHPVDLYSAQFKSKVPVFESAVLPYGSHEVRVVNTGEKNQQSSGHVIAIDAFYVIK
ncbi:S8 family serine peptidase [Paenibacillus glycanilyticus]|uniref:S8 family serine peptidase n=1 Tax=Paenibacillus glycanilyticus TaxID=126569 RepID=UPI00203E1093|nr:S8 family serine peptidase [Paenibacillus glycanilyticus]MCM3629075.1 S8 family serine peptidase [Paenibacillus glycanilyticus]